jgi:hypothetical protein
VLQKLNGVPRHTQNCNEDVDLADEEKNLVFYVFYKNREYKIERAGQKMLDSDFENLVYDALRKAWK